MADQQDRRFTTANVLSASIVSLLIGVLLSIAGFATLYHVGPLLELLPSHDTPVVLIGDALTFKSGAQKNPPDWAPSGTSYYVSPGHRISKIVLKEQDPPDDPTKPDPNDLTGPDRMSVKVPKAARTLEVDVINGSTTVATVTQDMQSYQIKVAVPQGASLCPGATHKEVTYSLDGTSPAQVTFSSVNVLADGTRVGTLPCQVAGGNSGYCRIVLRK